MKVLILEDETLAADKLEKLLTEVDSNVEIVARLKSIESGKEWFAENDHPDLILSDIRLLDGLSFELFRSLDIDKPVIFTTAYDQYAIKAFEVNSVDYLLKPIQKDKLASAIQKYRDHNGDNQNSAEPSGGYAELMELLQAKQKEYKSRFMIRTGQKIVAVPVEKIAYFFSQNKLTYIVAMDGKKYPFDQTLEVLDHQLDPKLFFRANRQYIVKFESIAEIHPHFKGRMKITLSPSADDEIVISAERTPEFKQWLDQ